ncbi:ApaG domain [Verrucomicrobiaceae bacterium 227]
MQQGFVEVPGLRVEVEEVIYMPHLDAPEERPFPFVYFLSIVNDSDRKLTIWGRKWIVRDRNGETVVVEGRGVVGETPVLGPGERFSYNSYHVVKTDSEASGSFFGTVEGGEKIRVSIPPFHLVLPVKK